MLLVGLTIVILVKGHLILCRESDKAKRESESQITREASWQLLFFPCNCKVNYNMDNDTHFDWYFVHFCSDEMWPFLLHEVWLSITLSKMPITVITIICTM